ncbi:MAG: tyrosine-type recombinase/integrase [Hydrogenoanaerobacterium sp.]
MASIRKRGNSYLIVVSMGYDYIGNRIKSQQKTVKPPENYTPKQIEKWLDEQAILFERAVKNEPQPINKSITLAQYAEIWLRDIAPQKLAKSTLVRDKREVERFLPYLGHHKLKDLRADMFREFYAQLRKVKNQNNGNLLAEASIEGTHSVICSVLTSAMEQGYITYNPAWRTYKPVGKRKEKIIADEESIQKLIATLEDESIKYEVFFKLIIATGMRRGECCGLRWSDIDFRENAIHVQRNAVKVADEQVFTKEPKTTAGDRYVYFSNEMATLLREYQAQCREHLAFYENRELTTDSYLFEQQNSNLPMTPSTFTARFKKILKKSGLSEKLNVHSLRHTNASLMIAGGVDVATAAGLLGHAQPSTTLDIYSHAFDKNKKKAHEQLQRGLGV